jgi:chromosome segregation ATPase
MRSKGDCGPVETVLRQVWGTAWKEAQARHEGERAVLAGARKAIEQERAEMLAEIGRLDGELDATREDLRQGRKVLEAERQAHEQMKSDAREARALAEEREKRITVLETERDRERTARAETEAALPGRPRRSVCPKSFRDPPACRRLCR